MLRTVFLRSAFGGAVFRGFFAAEVMSSFNFLFLEFVCALARVVWISFCGPTLTIA